MQATWLVLLMSAILLQQDELKTVKIPKAGKAPYLMARTKFKEATALLETSSKDAIAKVTEIIDDKNILLENVEVLLRIQGNDGVYDDAQPFTPYKLRGTARLKNARELGLKARAEAIVMAGESKKDFEISLGKGAKSCEELIKSADALIQELKDAKGAETPRDKKARELLAEIQKYLDANPAPEDAVKRLEDAAEDIKGTTQAQLYAEMLKAAKLRVVEADRQKKEDLIKPLRELDSAAAAPDDILRKCDEVGAVLTMAPWDKEIATIRERAQKAKKAMADSETALAAITVIRTMVKDKADPSVVIARCDEAAPVLAKSAFEGELEVIRKNAVADRLGRFTKRWTELTEDGSFRTASKYVAEIGTFLTPEELEATRKDVVDRSSRFVARKIGAFARELAALLQPGKALGALQALPQKTFDVVFALPDDAELLESGPPLIWARKFVGTLDAIRKTTDFSKLEVLDGPGAAAIDAATLPALEENELFVSVEALVHDLASQRVQAACDASQKALKVRREELRAEAVAVIEKVKAMHAKTSEEFRTARAFLAAHVAALEKLLEQIPADAPQVDAVAARLVDWQKADGVYGGTPVAALNQIEKDLLKIPQDDNLRLSIESRRKLATTLLITSVLKRLLKAEAPDAVAKAEDVVLYAKASWAEELGGPIGADVDGFGPKVKKIVDSLKP